MTSRRTEGRLIAVLGPTNTGKTYLAIERMLGHKSGMMDRMFYNGQRAGAMLTELSEQTRRVIKTNRGNTSHYRIYRVEQK